MYVHVHVHVHSNPYNYSNHSVRMVLGMFDNFQPQCCVEVCYSSSLHSAYLNFTAQLHWIMEHAIFAIHTFVHTHSNFI